MRNQSLAYWYRTHPKTFYRRKLKFPKLLAQTEAVEREFHVLPTPEDKKKTDKKTREQKF